MFRKKYQYKRISIVDEKVVYLFGYYGEHSGVFEDKVGQIEYNNSNLPILQTFGWIDNSFKVPHFELFSI